MGVPYSHINLADSLKELAEQVKALKEDNDRLRIENGLLRKASEEQRELNGSLRIELQENESYYRTLDSRS